MRKVQLFTLSWILILAVPLTALGIAQAAYLTDRMGEFFAWLISLGPANAVGDLDWLTELSARWPEVAGMIIGMVMLLGILILERREHPVNGESKR